MHTRLTTVAAFFAFFVLYGLQPLLPIFADSYGISVASAGALMTATLIPLAAAPLLYGYLLAKISPFSLLKYALLLMGASCLVFPLSNNYELTFALRLFQGLLLPAVFTAITTHVAAHSSAKRLQKNMSMFITGTILGGLVGRVLAGVLATYWSWQVFYYGLAMALIVTALCVPKPDGNTVMQYTKLRIDSVTKAFAATGVAKTYFSVFCLFFCFVALLNYLPFMVKALLENPSEMLLGFMYCGFVMGAVTSLNAQRLIGVFGGEKQVMLLGFAAFLLAILLLFIQQVAVIFAVLFLFCGAMFLVHSVAAADVNRRSTENKSIVNALYVTFYYSGGVMGSYFPGLLYQHYGHAALLFCLLGVAGVGYAVLMTVKPQ